jgi:O-antigen/teichoic acid export membrane protein
MTPVPCNAKIKVHLLLSKNIFHTFLTQIPTLIIGVFTGIFITRLLGPAGRGGYVFFQSNLDFSILFLGFNLNTSLVFYISSRKIAIEKLVGLSLISLFSGVFILLVTLTAIILLKLHFLVLTHSAPLLFFVMLFFAFFLNQLNGLISSIFQGKLMFKVINKITIINSVLNLVFFGLTLFYSKLTNSKITLETILEISICVAVCNSIIWVYCYLQFIRIKPSFQLNFLEDIKPLLIFASIGHISHIINFMNYRLDIWIVNLYKGVEQLGFYSLAVNVAQMLWMVSNPISTILYSHLCINNQDKANLDTLKLFSKINVSASLFLLAIGMFSSDFIFPLIYGKAFSASSLPYKILLIGVFFSCITKVFSVYILSFEKVIYNLICTIVGLISTISFDFILIPRMGIIGASIASSIAYFMIFFSAYCFLLFKLKTPNENYYLLTLNDLKHLRNKSVLYFSKK